MAPSRSASPREEHMPFYNRIWSKDDPFWNTNQPGTLWNCKCDWEQTDEEPTENNPTSNITKTGLDRNPATSGQIFTDTAPYIKKALKEVSTYAIRIERELFRKIHENDEIIFNTEICEVLYDSITVKEISKGAKTDTSYFYKLEIAQHVDKYMHLLQPLPNEAIDLSHNKHKREFYKRKKQFSCMKVYRLELHGYVFKVKLGMFEYGSLNLYCITEPE